MERQTGKRRIEVREGNRERKKEKRQEEGKRKDGKRRDRSLPPQFVKRVAARE